MEKNKNMNNFIFVEKWRKNKKKIENYRNNYVKDCESEETENFAKFCFRLGILEGVKFLEELKDDDKGEETFYNEFADFDEYLETKRIDRLLKNEEYNELRKEETKIKRRYPNIAKIIEGEEATNNLTLKEQNAISELIELKFNMLNIEKKEIYIMGMKEMINILYR